MRMRNTAIYSLASEIAWEIRQYEINERNLLMGSHFYDYVVTRSSF